MHPLNELFTLRVQASSHTNQPHGASLKDAYRTALQYAAPPRTYGHSFRSCTTSARISSNYSIFVHIAPIFPFSLKHQFIRHCPAHSMPPAFSPTISSREHNIDKLLHHLNGQTVDHSIIDAYTDCMYNTGKGKLAVSLLKRGTSGGMTRKVWKYGEIVLLVLAMMCLVVLGWKIVNFVRMWICVLLKIAVGKETLLP